MVCFAADRLTRRVTGLETLVELLEHTSTEVVSVVAGRIDPSTAGGRLNVRMMLSVANYESDLRFGTSEGQGGRVGGRGQRRWWWDSSLRLPGTETPRLTDAGQPGPLRRRLSANST